MKHCFLILPVAFLFCCTGCGVRKKSPTIKRQQSIKMASPKKNAEAHAQKSNGLLIKRSSQSVVQTSLAKKREEEVERRSTSKDRSLKERMAEIEARLGDLPVPLMVKKVAASDEGTGRYVMVYTTSLSLADLTQFYDQEMERLGWLKVSSFTGEELLFSFKKQKQSCIISVRPAKKSWWSKKPMMLHVYLQT